ncbi:MAG: riboflavin synthase [SAR202 cluster bacterium]|nr:riboflavin synthase [SAR202 cluster bacterium]|tara:strand:+ start:53691 stop:54269 length:579 start_codon:yes stop_codon:yes gene_type:complete
MFTGIVEELGKVIEKTTARLCVQAEIIIDSLEVSDSIAVNGACLTVVEKGIRSFCVDLSQETLQRTNLGFLKPGEFVNLERALTPSSRMGGHIVQGHVDTCGKVMVLPRDTQENTLRISLPDEYSRYVVEKGFIAIDGISLTVVCAEKNEFTIAVIPYTLQNTVLKNRKLGDAVNIEIDILAKYIERFTGDK